MPPKKTVNKPTTRVAKPGSASGKGVAAKKTAAPAKSATTAKKTGSASAKGKAGAPDTKAKDSTKPPVTKWTKEDEAARKIQTQVRGLLGRCALRKLRKEKKDYEELMEKLEKEAFVHLVKLEQEAAEKLYQKEQEERRKRGQLIKRQKRVLEAAFEGDKDEILTVLKEVSELDDKDGVTDDVIGRAKRAQHLHSMIECEDANGNTPLSEAASGGDADTVRLLIEHGANPNSHGHFKRTPLYRAAFAGHLEACQTLLQHGADPRLYADDGQSPEHVASEKCIRELLQDWDLEQTDRLLQKLGQEKEQRLEQDRKRRIAETSRLEEEMEIANKDHQMAQRRLCRATEELNKRIREHDECVLSGFERTNEVTLPAIHEAEAELEFAKLDLMKAADRLSGFRLQLREQQAQNTGDDVGEDDLPGLKVIVRELDDVLLRDVGNRIKESGRWPIIIDPSGQACLFLRYRDINYLNALNPADMEPDKIRLGLLGAIRFGKPLVLDMMEVDMFDTVGMKMDAVMPRLLDHIMDKSIMEEEMYVKLIKDSDGEEYQKNKFNEQRSENFRLFIITKNPFPPESLLDQTYPIRVHVPIR